jgi:DNA-binding transcriptional MocR family regulator
MVAHTRRRDAEHGHLAPAIRVLPHGRRSSEGDGWERGEGRRSQRLAAAIERALIAGTLAGPLPSERILAGRLGVSRGTVSAAYAELKERRLVTSRAGGYTRPDHEQLKAPVRAARLAARGMADGTILSNYIDRDPASLDLAFAFLEIPERLRDLVMHAYVAALEEPPSTEYLAAGRPELRERIAETFRAQAIPTTAEQIVVTQGAYQAIVLATLLALQPGDRVACECPMYPGALDIFRAHAATVYEVDSYDRPHVLELLGREAGIDMIYASTVYRNPTGTVMDHATAARLAHIAERRDTILIDDRALEHCGFHPGAPPPLTAYNHNAPIITLGSLDKTTGAGTRIGWIRAPRALAGKLTRLKALSDLASPFFMQGVALHLLEHLAVIAAERQRELKLRYTAAAAALAANLPAWRWQPPRGGSPIWIDTGMDADAIVATAARAGITFGRRRVFAVRPQREPRTHRDRPSSGAPRNLDRPLVARTQPADAFQRGAGVKR